ncbi:MAG: molybdopterin-dependent oxidoreductase [Planctomycetes bacterium]|nr:molybdopterin-dependent oxidoreductase [Planctomycetota bacterium]
MSSSSLPPGQQLAAPNKWPLVGERKPLPAPEVWTVEVSGCVVKVASWTLEQLASLPQIERTVDIHCVTRWSKLGARFGGVRLSDLHSRSRPTEEARFVSFIAHSERNHSTSLPLKDVQALDVMLALRFEGALLPEEHGGPVRVVTPGRYFYKSVKWLRKIVLLAEDELGHWERSAGYHNRADPWREERYLAPMLDRREAAKRIAARDFAGCELRSIDANGRDLAGLDARQGILRDANFRRARLEGARFDGANLSNAHFENADLRRAVFRNADVEGADFTGADLRGADFRGASLFGASFFSEGDPQLAARLDATTLIAAAVEQLTPVQQDYIRRCAPLGGRGS